MRLLDALRPVDLADFHRRFLGQLLQLGPARKQVLVFGGALVDLAAGGVDRGLGAQVGQRLLERDVHRVEDRVHRKQRRAEIGGDRSHDARLRQRKHRIARGTQIGLRHLAQVDVGQLQPARVRQLLERRLARVKLRLGGLRLGLAGVEQAFDHPPLGLLILGDVLLIDVAQRLVVQLHAVDQHFRGKPRIGDLAFLGRGEARAVRLVPGAQRRLVGGGDGGGQVRVGQFLPRDVAAFQHPARGPLAHHLGRGHAVGDGRLQDQPRLVHPHVMLEIGRRQPLAAQHLGVTGRVELAGRALERRLIAQLGRQHLIADRHADPPRLVLKRGGGEKPRLHDLRQADLARLLGAEVLPGLGCEVALFGVDRAQVVVGVDRGRTDLPQLARAFAREVADAETAEAQKQHPHQQPDDRGLALGAHAGHLVAVPALPFIQDFEGLYGQRPGRASLAPFSAA